MNKLNDIHEKAAEVSQILKTIAHPDRMVVLCLLADGEMGVSELSAHTQLSQSAFSQHLAVLRKKQLVQVRKEAQQVFYSVADPRITLLLKALQEAFCPNDKTQNEEK